jgi:hypothetical protein
MTNRATALRLTQAGLYVFPACPVTKRPLVRFTSAATRYERGVDYFWSRFGVDALPCLHLAGTNLLAVDLDRGHADGADGCAEFDKLVSEYGDVPSCPAVQTPRGGVHLYFSQPHDREPLSNSAGQIGPGIDVRGYHGFTVAPGAVLQTGEFYESIAGTPDLAEAFVAGTIPPPPDWLIELAERSRHSEPLSRGPLVDAIPERRLRAFALAVLEGEAAELADTPRGKRNHGLNKAAFVIASKGGAHGAVSEAETWAALWSACTANGYIASDGPKDFENTFYSGWNGGLCKPSSGPRERIAIFDSKFTAGLKPRAA